MIYSCESVQEWHGMKKRQSEWLKLLHVYYEAKGARKQLKPLLAQP